MWIFKALSSSNSIRPGHGQATEGREAGEADVKERRDGWLEERIGEAPFVVREKLQIYVKAMISLQHNHWSIFDQYRHNNLTYCHIPRLLRYI